MGKFCAKCNKTVEDFTKSSSTEIIQKLSEDRKICGKFTSNQLDHDYIIPWVKILMTALLTSGTVAYVDAQKVDSLFQKAKDSETNENAITLLARKVPRLTINKTKSEPDNFYDIQLGHPSKKNNKDLPLVVIDGVISTMEILQQIPPNKIKSLYVLLPLQAVALYQKNGRNGAMLVTTLAK